MQQTTKAAPRDVADWGRPAVRVFTSKDGLPQNTVQALTFDRQGYLWAGTQDGAARYNGRVWVPVHMPNRTRSNFVGAILSSSDGSMWFGTNGGGVARLSDGEWTVYDADSGSLPDDQIRSLLETVGPRGDRTLWVGTRGGLARFEGGRWSWFDDGSGLPNNVVRSLLETTSPDGSRVLWVGTREGLARFERGRWTVYDSHSVLPGNVVVSLLETKGADGRSALWVGTDGSGLARFSGGAWSVHDVATGLPGNSVRALAEAVGRDGSRTLWVGTDAGIARREGDRWAVLDASSGLPHKIVMSLLAVGTPSGTRAVWAGTMGSGVARVEVGRWLAFDDRSGLPNSSVWSLLETPGRDGGRALWAGTLGGGLARFENGGWSVYDSTGPLPHDIVVALMQTTSQDGARSLWAGTLGGGLAALRLDGRDGWSVYDAESGLPRDSVLSLYHTAGRDGAPVVWVGTDGGGLAAFRPDEGGRWTVYDTDSGLPNNVVACILETEARGGRTLWVGTNGGGLAALRLDGGGRWTVYDASSGLPNELVMGLHERRGPKGERTLWVGTAGGGAALLDLTALRPAWRVLSTTSAPAISSDTVFQIEEDREGRVYLFTNRGVDRLTPRAPTRDDPADFTVYTFTAEDGLPSVDCNSGSAMVDSLGRVWVGTAEGAGMFDPSLEVEDRGPKPLVVERTLVDGERRKLSLAEPLAHDENNLLFEYALLSFFREGDIRYRTQLAGFDRRPSEWSADWKREYTNLPEGEYVFRVWARDHAGNVSGPVERAFRVKAAPWRTWWAYSLYAGTAAAAAYGGLRLRLEALRRRNELLEATVAEQTAELAAKVEQLQESERRALESERTALEANRAKSVFLSSMSHELRTPLNAILGFVQVMERTPEREADDRESLAIIMRAGEHLLGLINDVLSISKIEAGKLTLNEDAFDLKLLLQGIEEMIRVRAQAKAIRLVVDVEPGMPQYVRGDEGKLRQVLVNMLGNAVKFTAEGGVSLRAAWRDGTAVFEVEDTGHGIAEEEIGKLFEPFQQTESGATSTEGTGLGLAISRSFVQLMGGDIAVRSALGRGTTFRFDVALPLAEGAQALDETRRATGLEPGQPVYRVLVVDDTPVNRQLMVKLLSPFGISVREAGNGREAVEVWETWHPHLIWMDMRLPVMSGTEATREIRRREEDVWRTKIVALTASAFEHDRQEIMEAGCDDFVAKPYREETIYEKLSEHVGVRFRYEQAEEPATAEALVTAERLSALPEGVLSSLYDAVVQGDMEAAYDAADAVRDHDAPLAEDLRRLVRAYKFDDLLDAIESLRS